MFAGCQLVHTAQSHLRSLVNFPRLRVLDLSHAQTDFTSLCWFCPSGAINFDTFNIMSLHIPRLDNSPQLVAGQLKPITEAVLNNVAIYLPHQLPRLRCLRDLHVQCPRTLAASLVRRLLRRFSCSSLHS